MSARSTSDSSSPSPLAREPKSRTSISSGPSMARAASTSSATAAASTRRRCRGTLPRSTHSAYHATLALPLAALHQPRRIAKSPRAAHRAAVEARATRRSQDQCARRRRRAARRQRRRRTARCSARCTDVDRSRDLPRAARRHELRPHLPVGAARDSSGPACQSPATSSCRRIVPEIRDRFAGARRRG